MSRSQTLNAWIETLKIRAEILARGDWESLAREAYTRLTARPALAVHVVLGTEGAVVQVVGGDGVRFIGFYAPTARCDLALIASCLGCWRDVRVAEELTAENYEAVAAKRSSIYCDTCLRASVVS